MDTTTAEKYKGVTLPESLVNEIDKKVNSGTNGFRSRAEYVAYAVRKELQQNASV